MEKQNYHLILGSNLGDRLQQITSAKTLLVSQGAKIIQESRIYETQPWGFDDQPWFLNQVVEIQSLLTPLEQLESIKNIEMELGREPGEKWHARHIDVDILLNGDKVYHHPRLIIPHPHLHERNFVLVPLMDIASEFMHPVLNKTIEELYTDCRDIGEVYIFSADERDNPV